VPEGFFTAGRMNGQTVNPDTVCSPKSSPAEWADLALAEYRRVTEMLARAWPEEVGMVHGFALGLTQRLGCLVKGPDYGFRWMSREFLAVLDPLGQAKWWSLYHGVIPPERFTVQLRSSSKGYVDVSGAELAAVARIVGAEREHFDFFPDPVFPAGLHARLKVPGTDRDGWLFEEVFPADRVSAELSCP